MKIRLKSMMAGPQGSFAPGTLVELPEAQAQDLVARGYAEAVTDLPANPADYPGPETAAIAAPEQAVQPPARPRRGEAGSRPEKRKES